MIAEELAIENIEIDCPAMEARIFMAYKRVVYQSGFCYMSIVGHYNLRSFILSFSYYFTTLLPLLLSTHEKKEKASYLVSKQSDRLSQRAKQK